MIDRLQTGLANRARGGRRLVAHYRSFLLDPGTLVTAACLLLLVAAGFGDPAGLVGGARAGAASPLYLASALAGSLFIWWSAIQGVRAGDFTADVPVSIATAAALAIGEYSAAAVVAALLLLGGMLEDFVAARAGHALEALARLLPDRVTVRRPVGDVVVPLDQIVIGDVLLIRSGERIAVDGEILAGSASIDQAAITGESTPVDREAGGSVFAGTLVSVGALEVRTTRVGDDTTLGQIRRMVASAQSQKAPIERLLDRYAKLYTPAALVLGALLWWQSGDVLRAITVLIVFCPCVMVLATPTALVASIGNAALRGSLVKKGATIEALSRVDTVAFDKTGTLTAGTPRLVGVVALDGLGERELLRACASAESFSEHPIARGVVRAAGERGLSFGDPEAFAALPGLGVRAVTGGRSLLIGRPKLLRDEGVALADDLTHRVSELSSGGRTVIVVASGPAGEALASQPVGLLVFEDPPRPEAGAALAALRAAGVRTALITGDNRATAERVAGALGIDEVHAEVSPQGKVEIVRRLQAKGMRVAFVGDGVNDAPSIAAADVGIAMGLSGTDVAIETAEIGLLSDDLSKLPHLVLLSRRAVRTIRQNLAFSLGVLGLAVGLTTMGFLTPVAGALLHELSSLPVIANSARLIGRRGSD